MNPNVHGVIETQSKRVVARPAPTPAKTHRVEADASPKKDQLEISDAGRQMAAVSDRGGLHTGVEARAALDKVTNAIKAEPEVAKDLHSNLRAMKINHLVFD